MYFNTKNYLKNNNYHTAKHNRNKSQQVKEVTMACCERLFGLMKHRIPLEISRCALASRLTCVTGNTMVCCERLFLSSFL